LFNATNPDWHVQQGQALWRPQRGLPEFGGELVVATDDTGRCLIQFDKTPMAILSAQITTNRWLIKFPQRQITVSADTRPGSSRFCWVYPRAALAGKPLPKQLHFENKLDGGWRWKIPAPAKLWKDFCRREFIFQTLVVDAFACGRRPRPRATAL
jgi:hypothetical protein